jgi:hypothetical protein
MKFRRLDGEIPRYALKVDGASYLIEKLGAGSWALYVNGKRRGELCSGRRDAELLAQDEYYEDKRKVRKQAWQDALARARGNLRNCDDAAAMAAFLDSSAHTLIGAVSPMLVWEGAQAKGMTSLELLSMIHDDAEHGTINAAELMWVS